jgi:ribosomal protein L5
MSTSEENPMKKLKIAKLVLNISVRAASPHGPPAAAQESPPPSWPLRLGRAR